MVAPYWVRLARLKGDARFYDRAIDEALRYQVGAVGLTPGWRGLKIQ